MQQKFVTKKTHIAAIQQLTDTIHSHGTKIFLQLQHPGKEGIAQLTNGPLVAPSVIPGSKGNMPRELSTEEVQCSRRYFLLHSPHTPILGESGTFNLGRK